MPTIYTSSTCPESWDLRIDSMCYVLCIALKSDWYIDSSTAKKPSQFHSDRINFYINFVDWSLEGTLWYEILSEIETAKMSNLTYR